METYMNDLGAKKGTQYQCNYCDFKCNKKYSWDRHINTIKHRKVSEETNGNQKGAFKGNYYICEYCDKSFANRSGLWKHNKICGNNSSHLTNKHTHHNVNNTEQTITSELVLELIKNNNEFKNIIVEQNNTINNLVKNGITHNYNTTNNNSHNKTFNLQVFLNETCKDAMNINDFVDSIKLQLSDFERMGEVGYAQGISDIITSNLQALDITQRPVHCTDKKRETMYVKDENEWMKEDENKSKIKKMIKRIENKNIQIIPQFQKKYPNYANPKSHESDKYHKTIIEVMGGVGGSEGKEGKIIRNISKVTTIREKE